MRLWSIHPRYLDPQGLVALWREGLLAQKVLLGGTRGYRLHPQLVRFREHPDPIISISSYLHEVMREASRRGYRFDATKLPFATECGLIEIPTGQLLFEWEHLLKKLEQRSPSHSALYRGIGIPEPHPLFHVVNGPIAPWERTRA